ncbi:MAG: hypothetical protein ACFCUU_15020 [Cyclobacteriaceae bacterium]
MSTEIKFSLLVIIAGFVCLLFCIASCSRDDITENEEEFDESVCNEADSVFEGQAFCDLEFIENYSGTACCVSGPVMASPGETLNYEYYSNISDTEVTWTVISGSIILTSGQNTPIATFEFGDDFTTGCIIGLSTTDLQCSESLSISRVSKQ